MANNRRVNPLNPLMGKIEKFEEAANAEKWWESSIVAWTAKRLNLHLPRLAPNEQYSFEYFSNTFSGFPLKLAVNKRQGKVPIHRDNLSVHPLWFKSFTSLPFVQEYEDIYETAAQHDPKLELGVVFPRKGFSQGLVLHNGDPDRYVVPGTSCHLYNGRSGTRLVTQPYAAFIDGIKKSGWTV